ncbi:serine hydrolase [Streptomyces sp. enrichment culture]|uniref:serine hydrolase n=1 Tax=Streptomyces sp. enrichment culture TaxID=1795815 RepID=UPI003F542B8C
MQDRSLGEVTTRRLLTDTAAVSRRAQSRNLHGTSEDDIRRGVVHEEPHRPPGGAVEYTAPAALILGFLAEFLSGHPLDQPTGTLISPTARRQSPRPSSPWRREAENAQ